MTIPDGYTAWLVELKGATPQYFCMSDDDEWTSDHNAALHLRRKEDAESIIAYYGWTTAVASEHAWYDGPKAGAEWLRRAKAQDAEMSAAEMAFFAELPPTEGGPP